MNTLPAPSAAEDNPFEQTHSYSTNASDGQTQREYNPFESQPSEQIPAMPWMTPLPTGSADPFTSYGFSQVDQRPAVGERIREKARAAKEMTKRAFAALGLRAPNLLQGVRDVYGDYGQKITGLAQEAATETVIAAATGGARALGERYGLGYENGKVTIESKRQLAKGAFRLLRMPQVEVMNALRTTGGGMYTAGRQEAISQAYAARDMFVNDARSAVQNVATSFSPFTTYR